MKPWSDFYDLLSPDVPNCPQPAQEQALRQSAIAFCEQSLAWKYTLPDFDVTVASADYDFPDITDAVVHAIVFAEFNDQEIDVNTAQDDMRIWNWRHQPGSPEYVLGGPKSFKLVPTPDLEGTLTMEVALKPSPTAETIDDDLYDEFREAIVHGALSRLMLSPKKPYTDTNLGTYHAQQFVAAAAAAGLRAARNYTRAPFETSIMRRR
jgi:hypothetical protein